MKEKNFEKYKIHLLIFVAAVAPPVNRAEEAMLRQPGDRPPGHRPPGPALPPPPPPPPPQM